MEQDKGLLYLFPMNMREKWKQVAGISDRVQEIRLRGERPVVILTQEGEFFLRSNGLMTRKIQEAYVMASCDLEEILSYMCHYSIYAFEDEIKKGYLTMPGGHRVGVTGQAVLESADTIKNMKHISYMNIRVAHQIKGAADRVLPFLYEQGRLCSTLIISPPGCARPHFCGISSGRCRMGIPMEPELLWELWTSVRRSPEALWERRKMMWVCARMYWMDAQRFVA